MSDDDDLVFRRAAKATTLDELDEYLETFNVLPSGRSAKTNYSRRPTGATARMQPLPSWSSSEEESYYQQRLRLSRLSPHSPYGVVPWSPSTSTSNGDQGLDLVTVPGVRRPSVTAPKEATCRDLPRFKRSFHMDNDPLNHRLSSHIALLASVHDDLASEPELIADEILDHSNRRRSKASHQTNTARSLEICEAEVPIFKPVTSMSDRPAPSQSTGTSWAVTQIFSRAGLAYLKGNLMQPFEKDILNYADFEIEADGFVLESSRCRQLTEKFFRSWAWEMTVWFFAIANAVVVCCNVEWDLHSDHTSGRAQTVFKLLELFYLLGFWMEMALQLGVFGSRFFVDMFAVMDLVILFFSLVPFGVAGALYGYDSPQARAFQSFSIARVLRVLRVVHIVRFDSLFREFWILVRGITYSLRVLLWGMSVGFLLIFVFAVPLTVFLADNPNISGTYDGWQMDMIGVDIRDYTSAKFGTIGRTVKSLFQIMTLDAWVELVDPVVVTSPSMWWFFVMFVAVSCFAFLNLLTAIIVESAINYSKDEQDREDVETNNRRRRLQVGMERTTKKTILTKSEYISIATGHEGFRNLLKAFGLNSLDDIHSICDILADPDDPESRLSIREFLLGVQRFQAGTAKSKDLMEALSRLSILEHITRQQSLHVKDLRSHMKKLSRGLTNNFVVLQEHLLQLTSLVQWEMGEALERLGSAAVQRSLSTIDESPVAASDSPTLDNDLSVEVSVEGKRSIQSVTNPGGT